jgi:ATP-dependent Lon protease
MTEQDKTEQDQPEQDTPEQGDAAAQETPTPPEGARPPDEAPPDIPSSLPLLPLKDVIVYPFAVQPFLVGQPRSIRLIDDIMKADRLVALVAQKDASVEQAGPDDIYTEGAAGRIAQLLRRPDGTIMVAVQGLRRIRVLRVTQEEPYLVADIEVVEEQQERTVETEALRRNVVTLFQQLLGLSQQLPEELGAYATGLSDPLHVVYLVAGSIRMDLAVRQEILELPTVREKLVRLQDALTHEVQVLELGRQIQTQAQETMTKAQREYFLREQLRAIQQELGEGDDQAAEVNSLREQAAELDLPEEARNQLDRELGRLERVPLASPEHSLIRTYVELLLALPWDVTTEGEIDVPRARNVLDEDHYDLERIKDRILEYLAVRKLKQERELEAGGEPSESRDPILCFVGPPGVGKTSLGQSIARALGRKFVRMSLGGIRDEAEVRGHRRTYIGAMPGRIIQGIQRAGSRDPVLMLDEVDKLSVGFQGDPAAALLEVLDPEQNHTFRDNYLDVPFDLSRVLFIATANELDPIPPPLRDRMEILQLSGYTEEEKLKIAEQYLIPRQLAANGLRAEEVRVREDALRLIIRGYTREAGVRNLERQIGAVLRKVARRYAEGGQGPYEVTEENVGEYLRQPSFELEPAERIDRPGIATGLVWTPVGGDIVYVEASITPSQEDRLILTGQLGDVMRESAQAALTLVRSWAPTLGAETGVFDNKAVHLHVPAGAIPKDGPSAGVTMASALASVMTGKLVRSDLAMTGEITLRGKVLPVGGVKEKVLAAHRAGLRTVVLPSRNERDLQDLTAELREEMTFVFAQNIDEVFGAALSVPEPASV